MTQEEASQEATRTAKIAKVRMVVTFNPYGEEEDEAENYSYFPADAIKIFKHEKIVETIEIP